MPSAAEVERLIRKTAADMGAGDLANLLVAIAKRESNLGQNNVGDNGDSIGPFQENINGRGRGLTKEQRMDPVASAKRAIAEIRTVQRANPGADPGTIAILAQRPAEGLRASYRADINAQVTRLGNTAQGEDGTRPAAVRPAPTAGRRPPSAIAQAAQRRALEIAGTQRRPQSQAATQGQARAMNQAFNGTYVMPVDGQVTNPYGGKQVYSAGKTGNIGSFNNGVDIATKAGTAVRAPVGGVVKKIYDTRFDDRKGERNADENGGWGGQVVIQGDDGKEHRLSHAQYGSIQVKEGQRVEQGQPTHKVGMSGNATGPHVDWEKWAGGKSEDALKAPLMPASKGAEAYQAALARLKAQQATPRAAPPAAAADSAADTGTTAGTAGGTATAAAAAAGTGATNVGQTSGNALVSTYDGLLQQAESNLMSRRRQMDEYQRELVGLQAQAAAGAKNVQQRIMALSGPADKPGTGLIGQLQEDITDLEQQRDAYTVRRATALEQAAGKTLTPEQVERENAETAHIKAQTEALRKKAAGEADPLERERLNLQIAQAEAEIAARDRSLNIQARQTELEAARNPSTIRATEAGAAQAEWDVAESAAMLPYNIDRVIASTDVDAATAERLRELLPAEVEKAWTDIWRVQQLTPIELEQGRADVDLTRQRSNELRQMLGPNIEKTLASAGVDRANIARIIQSLPLELADLTAQTQFRRAQTGLTEAQTGQVGEETRLTRYQADAEAERQKRWAGIEERIRANPNMGQQELDQLVLGAANSIQEWSTAYRAQLERQVATSEQMLATQRNQLTQQTADSDVRNQRMTEALGLEQNRVNQVNSVSNALQPGQGGPMRRMAQLGAMAPLVGSEGLRGVAMANRMGQMDLAPIQAAYKRFEEMVGGIRGSAPNVRMAPNVVAPPPIDIRFTPPTSMGSSMTPGPGVSPLTGPGATATSTAATLAPTTTPIDPYAPTAQEMDEQRRRFNVPTGSAT